MTWNSSLSGHKNSEPVISPRMAELDALLKKLTLSATLESAGKAISIRKTSYCRATQGGDASLSSDLGITA